MIKKLIRKLNSASGETFAEILVAVLIVTVSSALLVGGVSAASRINSNAIIIDNQYASDKESAQIRTEDNKTGSGTAVFSSTGDNVSVNVNYYGTGDIVSFSGKASSSDPHGGGSTDPVNPEPTTYPSQQVKVTFDPNRGTVSPTEKMFDVGKPYGELPIPNKQGYNFNGWYLISKVNGEEVKTFVKESDTVSVRDNNTLYADWVEYAAVQLYLQDQNGDFYQDRIIFVSMNQPYGAIINALGHQIMVMNTSLI